MNMQRVKTIIIKDWKEIGKSKQAVLPMIIVPLIFVVALPVIITLIASTSSLSIVTSGGPETFLKNFPAQLIPQEFNERQKTVYAILLYFFTPFFLFIPVMVSNIIASYSFAGEKEQKTIEGLLYTPVTDNELIFSKILTSFIPGVVISWVCFIIYGIIVNFLGFPMFHRIIFPNLNWLVLAFFLVPAISFLSLASVVMVSQKAASAWEAQQVAVLLILPILGLVISQAAGLIYLNASVSSLVGIIFLLIDILFFRRIVRNFNRERVITKV